MPKVGFFPPGPAEAIQAATDVAATSTPAFLAASTLSYVMQVLIKSDAASAGVAQVGDASAQTYDIPVGGSLVLNLNDPTKVKVKATTTATLHVLYLGLA